MVFDQPKSAELVTSTPKPEQLIPTYPSTKKKKANSQKRNTQFIYAKNVSKIENQLMIDFNEKYKTLNTKELNAKFYNFIVYFS